MAVLKPETLGGIACAFDEIKSVAPAAATVQTIFRIVSSHCKG
jgi:hypothetical protein